ncbi:DMT family transporter [Alteromonas sp. C1M14]|uniref:DMT family transporter n=1 Tax=Alteromonas sp. C1M14 TaxID=2841567 RepID=UPI001C093290|nr:DMT family transporter [Alteromonas sp. C1M14]MBU2979559.1 DMT family transporter [Alteromonas sp. C1M14]
MSWAFFTLLAVVFQTFRNAFQSQLSHSVSTSGVTLSRFLFAPPIALLYLLILYYFKPVSVPHFTLKYGLMAVAAAMLQIAATSLMVILFKQKNFAIGAGLAKSEALAAGIFGTLLFGSVLTPMGWVGIVIGTFAVFVLSGFRRGGEVSLSTVFIGLACGTCFAFASLLIRELSHLLPLPSYHSAAWTLLWILCIQTFFLCSYIALRRPQTMKQLGNHRKFTLVTSFASCVGSICWFTAMTLNDVAYVKTLGQVEVLLTMFISVFWLKKRVAKHEVVGLMLIGLAAIFVLWS